MQRKAVAIIGGGMGEIAPSAPTIGIAPPLNLGGAIPIIVNDHIPMSLTIGGQY